MESKKGVTGEMSMVGYFVRTLAICGLLAVTSSLAHAQGWPSRPVRLVVAFPPGGIVDTVARLLQPGLQQALGQPVVVENRGGAGGTIASNEVARAAPDGHTLLMIFDSFATYPLVYSTLTFDTTKDLLPVTQLASNPLVLVVHPTVPAKDLKTFIELLKSQPGHYNYASVGVGSSNHLTAELFQATTGTTATHVPYRGGGPAQQDLIGGQVQLMFLSAVLARPHVQAGTLRALAQTGAERIEAYPDIPTVAESGYPDFIVSSWVGLLAPAGTPRAVVDRLRFEINKIMVVPAFTARLQELGLTGIANTPEQFAAVLRAEQDKWRRLVKERQLKLD